jgi:hypothetical protein
MTVSTWAPDAPLEPPCPQGVCVAIQLGMGATHLIVGSGDFEFLRADFHWDRCTAIELSKTHRTPMPAFVNQVMWSWEAAMSHPLENLTLDRALAIAEASGFVVRGAL